MSRIRSRTKFEADFIKLLSRVIYPKGYRYRKHLSNLPGKPDIAFIKQKLAVFLDGDFWHGYNLEQLKRRPISAYWLQKITANMRRDRKQAAALRKAGWKVLRFWEHEVEKSPVKVIKKIESVLKKKP